MKKILLSLIMIGLFFGASGAGVGATYDLTGTWDLWIWDPAEVKPVDPPYIGIIEQSGATFTFGQYASDNTLIFEASGTIDGSDLYTIANLNVCGEAPPYWLKTTRLEFTPNDENTISGEELIDIYLAANCAGNPALPNYSLSMEGVRSVPAVDETPPIIFLNGIAADDRIDWTQNLSFTEADALTGVTAEDNVDGDISGNILVEGLPIDTGAAVGTQYPITFDVQDAAGNDATRRTRTVTIVGDRKPVISLVGSADVNVTRNTAYVDDGATANDFEDGDLTDKIDVGGLAAVDTTTVGDYEVTYDVQDSAGNDAVQVIRTVHVVDTLPVITLLGENPMTISVGTPYAEPGATALDDVDGDISDQILTGGDVVDGDTIGVYRVTYDVMDSLNQAALQVVRTVNVIEIPEENELDDEGGIFYYCFIGSLFNSFK